MRSRSSRIFKIETDSLFPTVLNDAGKNVSHLLLKNVKHMFRKGLVLSGVRIRRRTLF